MSREIKFRAWDRQMTLWEELCEYPEAIGLALTGGLPGSTLMQYTGLKDKNGVEIYEGDIIRCASTRRCPHEVVWMDEVPSSAILGGGMPGFYLSGLNAGYAFLGGEEVIGNIYEHPHLLGKEASGDL